jgi:putative ABC transport system permease protein
MRFEKQILMPLLQNQNWELHLCIVFKQLTIYILSASTAWQELRNNKLRTTLSLLGISIGIFCIVGVYTMVDSLKRNIQDSLSSLGNDVLYVNKFAWMPEEGEKEYPFWKYKSRPQAKQQELKWLIANVPAIAYGTMLYTESVKVKFDNIDLNVSNNAVSYDFEKMQNLELIKGRYFTIGEMQSSSNTVLLGNSTAKNLFANINPIGKAIKMYDRTFIVIGVLKKRGEDATGMSLDDGMITSYNYINSFKNLEDDQQEFQDNTIMLRPRKAYPVQDLKYEVKGALRAARRIAPSKEDNFSFNLLSAVQNQVESIFKRVNLAGFCIGILSLLVGAFGIANIMFVIVKERTSQIGLKKAIGAKRSVILIEFLIEAIMLCIVGGLIGIGFVMLLAWGANSFSEFPISLSLNNFFVGVGISVIVGIISGITPALKASKLDPVVAIRS